MGYPSRSVLERGRESLSRGFRSPLLQHCSLRCEFHLGPLCGKNRRLLLHSRRALLVAISSLLQVFHPRTESQRDTTMQIFQPA